MIRTKLLALALVSSAALACGGTARPRYAATDPGLDLSRVVLYRNGVGYFERTGKVKGDVLTLKVRKDQVNDLLKSLTIVERKSGRAVSVSMPLDPQTWANAALATLRPGQGSLAQVLDSLRGSHVSLRTGGGGSVRGRVAMVEQLSEPVGDGESVRIDHRVSLLDGDALRVVKLSDVRGVVLEDGDLAMQFNRTLDASAGEGMFQQVAVSVRLAGARSHDLLVSYVVAAPMWKPTYRVVLPAAGQGRALLQAWAVVDNTSGEEWRDVRLALTSGAPIAFRYDLHTPRDIPRPDLTQVGVHRQAEAMVGETTYRQRRPRRWRRPRRGRRPSRARAPPAPTPSRGRPQAGGAGRGAAGGPPTRSWRPAATAGTTTTSRRPRSTPTACVARPRPRRAQTVAGQTRFELGDRVTVPDGTSTMVAIVNADVEGEEAFLFRPGGAGRGYEANPYRVVRFKNSTPFVLEPGPIGIYAGGSFVGEGLSETVGAGTSATIPFAVETGLTVTSTTATDRDEHRLIKMSRGVLEVEQFSRRTTTYTAKAQTLDAGFTVLVRHARAGGSYVLASKHEGLEELPDAYLLRLVVAPGSREGTLAVVEQTPTRTTISIWNQPALDLLEKLVVHAELGADARARLRPILEKRRAVAKLDEQLRGLTERRNKLDQRANELRQNLAAIAKNPRAGAQRDKWTKQLDEFASEGNKLGAQLADLEAKKLDLRVELDDALDGFELVGPPAK
ncbi:MAG: DUF4139 domain-containing protein [Kofleriaceae bacterium]|nr:DUF4139 domain-containing protein [Kofleriaceae bacterium]